MGNLYGREIIGFCTNMSSNADSARVQFKKIIVNNGDGRKIQVVGWGEQKTKLLPIDQDGLVVHLTSLTSSIPKDQKYNAGNVPFELLIKPNSKIHILGTFGAKGIPELTINNIEIKDVFKFVDQKVAVCGFIKSPLKLYQSKDFSFYVGSITDGKMKLEIRSTALDVNKCPLKGQYIKIVGKITKYLNNVPYLSFAGVENIQELTCDGENLTMSQIIGAYEYVN